MNNIEDELHIMKHSLAFYLKFSAINLVNESKPINE